jgi:hypothetical protein
MATRRRRVKKPAKGTEAAASRAADSLFQTAPNQSASPELAALPELGVAFTHIRESTFSLADPEGEFRYLESRLALTEALTPGNLQSALNIAEDCARRAHRLYVVARADFERFEIECEAIVEGMRSEANRELQAEKDRKERSKAITDADIRGRAAILFPDEWALVSERKVKAQGMLDHLKRFADLWQQRCYSLSTMLNAGKRS